MNKWVKGPPSIQEAFDGHTYYFADQEGKRRFSADPAKYAPVLGGDCVVSLVKTGKRVPGNIRQASLHDGRLFLFANEQGRQMFAADPRSFANADLAFGGQCAVCRGPFKQVEDDDDHVYYRGERMAVCDKTFRLLQREPYAAQFELVEPRDAVRPETAERFEGSRPKHRHPRETKGLEYDVTSEAQGTCTESGGNCC